jgi:hypothetical protein
MKVRHYLHTCAVGIFLAWLSAISAEIPLAFNGKDLAGWAAPDPNPFWTVKDGVLVGENDEKMKGHVLYTEKSYKDFVFECEVRWSGEIDSGVLYRQPALQLQFGVSRSLKTDMTCSFYTGGKEKYPEAGRARELNKCFKPNDWNRVRLEVKGDVSIAWLNGQKVSEYKDAKFSGAGPIGVQIHSGLKMKVEYRDIRIQEL